MNRWMKTFLCLTLFCVIPGVVVAMQQDPQLPAGTLSAKQIKQLFTSRTVSAYSVDGKEQEMVIYFGRFGKVQQAKKGFQEDGKWRVRKDARLCVELKGAPRACRIIVKNDKEYRQYVVKKDGKHKHELTYVEFRKGKHLARMSTVPLLPQGTLDRKQVKQLFSGKTVESITASKGRISHSYYAQDGSVEQVRNGQKRYGKWRVTKNGRICLQMNDRQEKCRIIVKQKGEYKKYIVKKNGRHTHSVSYRNFIDAKQL